MQSPEEKRKEKKKKTEQVKHKQLPWKGHKEF